MERDAASSPSAAPAVERFALVAVAVYFGLRVLGRTVISDTPEIDEGEQLLQAQAWRWGYGPQPPLYGWVQMLFFAVLGKNIFALSLLKNLLLFGTCALAGATGRLLTGSRRGGVAAMLALFFIPQFVWYSQNDLTHSVMAQFFTAALFFTLFRLLNRKTFFGYVLLGVIITGGLLSKYNFIVLLSVLLAALLTWQEGRRLLRDWRALLAAGVSLLLLAPHLDWVRHHPGLAFSKASHLITAAHPSLLVMWGRAFLEFLEAILPYFVSVAVAGALVLGRLPKPADLRRINAPDQNDFLPRRILIITVCFALAAILAVKATFDERWLQQNMYALPLLVAVLLTPQLDARRFKRLVLMAAFMAVVVFAVQTGRVALVKTTRAVQKQNLPLRELADQLRAEGVRPGTILVENFNPLGGALAMAFPDAAVLESSQMPPPAHGSVLVVWRADARPPVLQDLSRLAARNGITNLPWTEARRLEAPLKFWPERRYQLAYLMLPEIAGQK